MTRRTAFRFFLTVNILLAGALLFRLHKRSADETPIVSPGWSSNADAVADGGSASGAAGSIGLATNGPATTFSIVYSADPKTFADNLRAIRCPEETVKDILAAEIHRRFRNQEDALHPTPSDHVPFGWSATTTEPRLLERREQAAGLSREEGSMLRDALGCVAPVPMPQYAMTSYDQWFEEKLSASPGLDACSIRQVHDDYWAGVQALLRRTKGF